MPNLANEALLVSNEVALQHMPSHCAALTCIEWCTSRVNNVLTYSLIHTQLLWVTESCSNPSDHIACIAKNTTFQHYMTWYSLRYIAPTWRVAVNNILVRANIAAFQEVPLITRKIPLNISTKHGQTMRICGTTMNHSCLDCLGNIAEIWSRSNLVPSSLFVLYIPPGQVFVLVAGRSTQQINANLICWGYAKLCQAMPSYANRVNVREQCSTTVNTWFRLWVPHQVSSYSSAFLNVSCFV